MIKFSVPDFEFDQTLIEQAAKNNAIIIMPEYGNPELLIETYEDFIKESGLTYPNGDKIKVVTYREYIDEKMYCNRNLVISNPYDIISEFLCVDDRNMIIVEYSEYQ